MKFLVSLLTILTIVGLSGVGCQGPLVSDPSAVEQTQFPEDILPENRQLRPRRSPLGVGEQVPRFVLPDQLDRDVSAEELMSGKGSLIVFIPGWDSPASRPTVEYIRRHREFLAQRGVELIVVTPDSVNRNAQLAQIENLRVGVLHDSRSWVARSFGVVGERESAPSGLRCYLIAADGRIHLSRTSLPDASEVVMAAESLPGTRSPSIFAR